MYALGLITTILALSPSIFYTAYSRCGESYLKTCHPSIPRPKAIHIFTTEVVGDHVQCVNLCNTYRNECLSYDIRKFDNGSYNCRMFKKRGVSNCAVSPYTKHFVRVRVFCLLLERSTLLRAGARSFRAIGKIVHLAPPNTEI